MLPLFYLCRMLAENPTPQSLEQVALIQSWQPIAMGIEVSFANGPIRLQVLSEAIIRLRYASGPAFQRDFSYAISDQHPYKGADFAVQLSADVLTLTTAKLVLTLNGDKTVNIKTTDGLTLLEDQLAPTITEHYENGTTQLLLHRKIQNGEHFYGLGDKPGHPDLRNHSYTIWGTDQYGFYSHTDPLYKNIPFYIGLHNHQSYGLFFDNTFKSHFDFGKTHHETCSISFEGGEINQYFIYGPDMLDVCRQYTLLTGVPELPPLWALGYQQCKWSYYPEAQVNEIAQSFRDQDLPCDVIYLDIDYMDGFRCFTWDNEKFPHPKKMIAALKEKGFKTVVIIDPGIKIDENYSVFTEALEKDYFCRKGEGGYISGKVWPGECYFPDYTHPEVRQWWADLFEDLIADKGVVGVWNDMNEPALFDVPNKSFPNDVRHHFDGEESSHKKAHNVYGMLMSKATYEGVKKYAYPNRPFVITRSTYSGGQRYASVWTGDNIASWNHLWIANVMTQRLSLSGFSFVGSDIGGFIDPPTPELYVRWIQLALFHPFFRTHSSGDHGDQEPWSFGEEALTIVRKFIKLRYRFLPYIYSTFYQYVTEGTPMLRPLYACDTDDMHTHYRADEVMHGDHILYCPMLEEGLTSRSLFLPKGNWYHYFSNEITEGAKEHMVEVPLDSTPLFIREGAIIPHFPPMNYVGEKKIGTIDLFIYYKHGEESSFLYEDEGDGYNYLQDQSLRRTFSLKGTAHNLHLTQTSQGSFTGGCTSFSLHFIGLPFTPHTLYTDGKEIRIEPNKEILVSSHFQSIDIM